MSCEVKIVDFDEGVVIVEGDIDSDDRVCEHEATQSRGAHVLPACVNHVQQSCTDSSLDSSYLSSSSSSTVTIDSSPSSLMSCL